MATIESERIKEIIKFALHEQGYLEEDKFVDNLIISPLIHENGQQYGISMTYTVGIRGSIPYEISSNEAALSISILAKYMKLREHFFGLVRNFLSSKEGHEVRAIITFVPYLGGEKHAEMMVHPNASVPEGRVLIHPSDYFKIMRGDYVKVETK
jgi:hypothetical protein